MTSLTDQLIELNANYNYLGEDLVMLESVLQAAQRENDFPEDLVVSSLTRVNDYIHQHTGEINQMAEYLHTAPKGFQQSLQ